MGIKITSVDAALEDTGTKILVHGPAGAGKTTMAATSGIPTLIISAESGLLSIKGAPDYIQTTAVKSLEDLGDVYEFLTSTHHGFEMVILDSISEIGEVVLSEEKRSSKDARAAYGNMIDMMTVMMKRFRDLPVHVMMTCKQQRIEDSDTGHTVYAPQLPGNRLANDLPYLFDEVLALRVEKDDEGKTYRTLQTGTDLKYVAKDRSGSLDMFEPPNLKAILQKIHPEGIHPPKQESEPEPERPKTAPHDMYFYHPESDSAFMYKSGEEIDWGAVDICTEVKEDEYNALMLEAENKKAEAAAS